MRRYQLSTELVTPCPSALALLLLFLLLFLLDFLLLRGIQLDGTCSSRQGCWQLIAILSLLEVLDTKGSALFEGLIETNILYGTSLKVWHVSICFAPGLSLFLLDSSFLWKISLVSNNDNRESVWVPWAGIFEEVALPFGEAVEWGLVGHIVG